METDSIFIQDNTTSRKELWDIQQETTSHYRSFNQVETIFTRCYRKVQDLDRSWKSQILQGVLKVKWKTSEMVSEVIRLWFHTVTYTRKNKHEGRHPIKKRLSEYSKWQQRHTTT